MTCIGRQQISQSIVNWALPSETSNAIEKGSPQCGQEIGSESFTPLPYPSLARCNWVPD